MLDLPLARPRRRLTWCVGTLTQSPTLTSEGPLVPSACRTGARSLFSAPAPRRLPGYVLPRRDRFASVAHARARRRRSRSFRFGTWSSTAPASPALIPIPAAPSPASLATSAGDDVARITAASRWSVCRPALRTRSLAARRCRPVGRAGGGQPARAADRSRLQSGVRYRAPLRRSGRRTSDRRSPARACASCGSEPHGSRSDDRRLPRVPRRLGLRSRRAVRAGDALARPGRSTCPARARVSAGRRDPVLRRPRCRRRPLLLQPAAGRDRRLSATGDPSAGSSSGCYCNLKSVCTAR